MSDTINPRGWPRPSGYSNGIVAEGRYLAISGQIGWNERNELVSDEFLPQARQALRNVMSVVRAAGGEARHLVRLTWYVTDANEYRQSLRELGAAYREIVGDALSRNGARSGRRRCSKRAPKSKSKPPRCCQNVIVARSRSVDERRFDGAVLAR